MSGSTCGDYPSLLWVDQADEPSLVELVRQAQTGDANALNELLGRLGPPIRYFAKKELRKAADPEAQSWDIMQETLIRIAQSVRCCRANDRRSVTAWILQITRRALADFWRKDGVITSAMSLDNLRDDDSKCYQGGFVRKMFEGSALVVHADVCNESESLQILTDGSDLVELNRILLWAFTSIKKDVLYVCMERINLGTPWETIAELCGITPAAAKRKYQRATATVRRRALHHIATLDNPILAERLIAKIATFTKT